MRLILFVFLPMAALVIGCLIAMAYQVWPIRKKAKPMSAKEVYIRASKAILGRIDADIRKATEEGKFSIAISGASLSAEEAEMIGRHFSKEPFGYEVRMANGRLTISWG